MLTIALFTKSGYQQTILTRNTYYCLKCTIFILDAVYYYKFLELVLQGGFKVEFIILFEHDLRLQSLK